MSRPKQNGRVPGALKSLDGVMYQIRMRFVRMEGLACILGAVWLAFLTTGISNLPLQAAPVVLEAFPSTPAGSVDFRLHGETSATYVVESSTNLATWSALRSVQTINGLATFTSAVKPKEALFVRARGESSGSVARPSLKLNLLDGFGAGLWLTREGLDLELVTSDVRTILLHFPSNAVINPVEIQVSVVASFEGLPFAQGTVGAVQLEPEFLALSGAATLNIELPRGADSRHVTSFTVQNDGSDFHLMPDRVSGGQVTIPFTRFATYGTALSKSEEIQVLLGISPAKSPNALHAANVQLPWFDTNCYKIAKLTNKITIDTSAFPKSLTECFPTKILTALDVKRDLEFFMKCALEDSLATVLAIERQNQLLGMAEDENAVLIDAINQVCPIYESLVRPLFEVARFNCALGIVLFQFMAAWQRQVQLLGGTDRLTCDFSLGAATEDLICQTAVGCLNEIQMCCALGHKGQEKYLEVSTIMNQFQSFGNLSCLPAGMDEPKVQEVLDVCMTNGWYGEFTAKRSGQTNKVSETANSKTRVAQTVYQTYNGGVFQSNESPGLPGFGKALSLVIAGKGTIFIEDLSENITTTKCPTNGMSQWKTHFHSITKGEADAIASIFGKYSMTILIKPDNQYEVTGISPPQVMVQAEDTSTGYKLDCDGTLTIDPIERFTHSTAALFPIVLEIFTRPMPDTNEITGSIQFQEDNGDNPFQTTLSWKFKRLQRR